MKEEGDIADVVRAPAIGGACLQGHVSSWPLFLRELTVLCVLSYPVPP